MEVPAAYRYHLLAAGKSAGTVKQRMGDIERFSRRYPELFAVCAEDLVVYLGVGAECAGWKPEYLKKIRASFRSFYRWAHLSGRMASDPAYALMPVAVPRPLPHPTPEDVVLEAFAQASLAVRAMILLAATEGLRRSEIAALHPRNRRSNTIRFFGKGSRERAVPLDELTRTTLVQLEHEQGTDTFYFPGRFGGHLHSSTVYKWVTELTRGWTLHSLRHRAATMGYAGTKDLRATQEVLGHSSPATTQIYTAVAFADLQAVVSAASLPTPRASRSIAGDRMGIWSGRTLVIDLDSVSVPQLLAVLSASRHQVKEILTRY
ncbi:tyrosine-type recombinase/integrase [Microbacterium sp. STN6]|uniref:tyrosine-type recombinase/integrase n=1 Tax=Microbacterium sp. STN6 TaxID=2995588 RepID=UPI002260B869|nr:tyrosine-type recombinase/integrase [Microbacterium sp. STN6]MCX7521961.1 tyrosine-type recombinase/integrase [Microbacterium sp. STN6]